MKILQVTNLLSPVHGGAAEVPYQLSRELVRKGHQVTIYTSDYKYDSRLITPLPELEIHAFKTWLALANFHITPEMARTARKEIEHFDIIHLHNYRSFQNIAIYWYARKHNIPYVLQAHGSLTTFRQKGTLKRIFDAAWGNKILRNASKVIAVSKAEAEQYQSMGVSEDKIEIVPNGIDLAEFENLPESGEFRRKYNLGDDERIILYLGRIHKTKGLDLLAEAFAELSMKLSDARLVIVGPDDGYLRTLEQLIKRLDIEDKVLLTGPLFGREKLEAYVDADVFVNPRADEIFGLVFLEALACGTPVVCSVGCGISDMIDGQVGLAVPYDKDALGKAILDMLSDNGMRQEFGEKGRALVKQDFNWQKIAERIEQIYRLVLER